MPADRLRLRDVVTLDNPVLERELRGSLRRLRQLGSRGRLLGWAVPLAVIYGLVLLWMVEALPADDRSLYGEPPLAFLVWFGVILMLAPGATATTIAGERQRGTWDLLLTTRLCPAQVVIGKLLGRSLFLTAALALLIPPLAVLGILDGGGQAKANWALLAVTPHTLLLLAIGLHCSARQRTAAAATAWAYGLAALVMVGALAGEIFLLETTRFDWFGASTSAEPLLGYILSPMGTWIALADRLGCPIGLEFDGLGYAGIAVQGLLAFLLIYRPIAHFERWLGRAPEGRRDA